MTTILITVYCIFFAYLAWRRFDWALILLFTLLPTYLIRFNIGMMPTTLLEVMIWIVAMVWLITRLRPFGLRTGEANYEW